MVEEQARRYELKVVRREVDLPLVRARLRLHPDAYRLAFPPRDVNSVYFDTPDHACVHDNLTGISDRAKVRYRWYGDLGGVSAGQLELKCKANQLGWKVIEPVDAPIDLGLSTWREVWGALRDSAGATLRPWLETHDRPTLLVRYRRDYYESGDGSLRLTLDTGIEGYEQVLQQKPNLTRPAPASGRIVIELKADAGRHRGLSDALNAFSLPVERHSKYVDGLRGALCFT